MKKLTFILATALMMTACATNVEKQAEVPAIDINNFDEAIDLKADFYQWATGGWQKNNPLKPEFSPSSPLSASYNGSFSVSQRSQ